MILNGYKKSYIYGVASVLSEFHEASFVIHGPGGCYSQFLEATANNKQFLYYTSSAMNNDDVIFGGEKSLLKEILALKPSEAKKTVFIMASNAPLVIGEDMEGIISKMKKDFGLHNLILIEGAIGKDHYSGVNITLVEMAKQFTKQLPKIKRCINLIGNIGGSIRWKEDLFALKSILSKIGIKVNLIATDITKENIALWSRASLTVKLTSEIGYELGAFLENTYGIPFIDIDFPIGISATTKWIRTIASQLEVNPANAYEELYEVNRTLKAAGKNYIMEEKAELIKTKRVAIVCDASVALSFQRFFISELGVNPVLLGLIINLDCKTDYSKETKNNIVLINQDRDTIEAEIQNNSIDMILGSSHEYEMARSLNKPFLNICNPNYHLVNLNPRPYLGYKGVLNLIEDLFNRIHA